MRPAWTAGRSVAITSQGIALSRLPAKTRLERQVAAPNRKGSS